MFGIGRLRVLVVTVLAALSALVLAPATASASPVSSISCTEPAPTEGPADASLESYASINPRRIVDTRDGTGGARGAVGAGCVLRIAVDAATVPANADAVGLSVTAIADDPGYLSVFPCRSGQAGTSNVNARAGVPTANFVVGMLDSRHELCIYVRAGAHLVVDLVGW